MLRAVRTGPPLTSWLCGFPCDGTHTDATCNYEYYVDRMTWAQAEEACVLLGGHLASILSQDDMDQLLELPGIAHSWAWYDLLTPLLPLSISQLL